MSDDAADVFHGLWQMLVVSHGGPALEREFRFDSVRQWRIDAAAPPERVAVEVEGGAWGVRRARACPLCGRRQAGRHTTGAGFEGDLEKYNALAEAGWLRLAYTPKMLDEAPVEAVCQVLRVLVARAAGERAHLWREALKGVLTASGDVVK